MANISTHQPLKESKHNDEAVIRIAPKLPNLHLRNSSLLNSANGQGDSTNSLAANRKYYPLTDRSSSRKLPSQFQPQQNAARAHYNNDQDVHEEDNAGQKRQKFQAIGVVSQKAAAEMRNKEKEARKTPVLDALESDLHREEQIKAIKARHGNASLQINLNHVQGAGSQRKPGVVSPSQSHSLSKNQSPRYFEETNALTARTESAFRGYPNLLQENHFNNNQNNEENAPLGHISYRFFPVSLKKSLQLEGAPPRNPPFKVGLATAYNSTKIDFKPKETPRNDAQNPLSDKTSVRKHPLDRVEKTNSINYTPLRNNFALTHKLKNLMIRRTNFLGISNLQIDFEGQRAKHLKKIEWSKPKEETVDGESSLAISPEVYRTYLKMRLSKLKEDEEKRLFYLQQLDRVAAQTDNSSVAALKRLRNINHQTQTDDFQQEENALRTSSELHGKIPDGKSNVFKSTQESFKPMRSYATSTLGDENKPWKIKVSTHILGLGIPEGSPNASFKSMPQGKKLKSRNAIESEVKINAH